MAKAKHSTEANTKAPGSFRMNLSEFPSVVVVGRVARE